MVLVLVMVEEGGGGLAHGHDVVFPEAFQQVINLFYVSGRFVLWPFKGFLRNLP